MAVEIMRCRSCGSAEVTEFKAGSYVCGHCEAVFRHVHSSGGASCACGITASTRCGVCDRPICRACDLGYSHAGLGCPSCAPACPVCERTPQHADEGLWECQACKQYVHSPSCVDLDDQRLVTIAASLGFPETSTMQAWHCRRCTETVAHQTAERERRNPSPRRFAEGMRLAGYPGAVVSRVAEGQAFSLASAEVRCWPLGTSRESAPTQVGTETVHWYVAEDGTVYEMSAAMKRSRFGKKVWAQALVRPKSGRYGIANLGPLLVSIAERHGVEL
jgi:ribosomal protein L37AE/L43A